MTRARDDDDDDDYWSTIPTNDQIREEEEANPRRRGPNKHFGADPISPHRMSQTEVALRLARHLCEWTFLGRDVYVGIGGAEVNRNGNDVATFPVVSHLSRWGFTKEPIRAGLAPTWHGFYVSGRTGRKILLYFDKSDGHIMTFLPSGQRLIVHCTAGNIGNTRSPAEHHDLHRAMGRAISWRRAKHDDVIAVCTPRSERFRKMTDERRQAVGVQRAGLHFVHVDRGGGVTGLSAIESP